MKRLLAIMCVLMLMVSVAGAETKINATENRGIKLSKVDSTSVPDGVTPALANVPEGVSPTTGLTLSDYDVPAGYAGLAATGIYFPVLVQISCPYDEKTYACGTGNRAPWGVQYADIIYELPLHQNGEVRMSALFSDVIPDAVGPIRSARVGHVWLREEWDCGFMYYGQQEYKRTNVIVEVRRTGASEKGLLWPGTSGSSRPWKAYYTKYTSKILHNSALKAPNNRSGNPAGFILDYLVQDLSNPVWSDVLIYPTLIKATRLYADDAYTGGDSADTIHVSWNRKDSNEIYRYNASSDVYERYLQSDAKNSDPVQWVELESQVPLTFSNLIVQWTETTYLGRDAPVTQNIGAYDEKSNTYAAAGGNCDIFMNGRHIAGYWQRDAINEHTAYYDENGQQVALQRGKTMVIQLPLENSGLKKPHG